MSNMELQIDPDFKHLIRPLKRKEYLQLESNLLADGCREPITTWNGIIVDGHNRYEICKRHNIPFTIHEIDFDCKEAAIAWICANQLGRRNITEETRKFLIGMQYESEKIVNSKRNARGLNQYSAEDYPGDDYTEYSDTWINSHITAERIAQDNHISNGTVQKYARYTRALEEIGRKEPQLVPKILSGQYKISHKNLIELSNLSDEEVKRINRKIDHEPLPFIHYKRTRTALQAVRDTSDSEEEVTQPSVKDMPQYDPDAEIAGLTLTIPSWISSMERTLKNADLRMVSEKAKDKLGYALLELHDKTDEMLTAIQEVE